MQYVWALDTLAENAGRKKSLSKTLARGLSQGHRILTSWTPRVPSVTRVPHTSGAFGYVDYFVIIDYRPERGINRYFLNDVVSAR